MTCSWCSKYTYTEMFSTNVLAQKTLIVHWVVVIHKLRWELYYWMCTFGLSIENVNRDFDYVYLLGITVLSLSLLLKLQIGKK